MRLGYETFGKGKDSDNKKETHAYSVAYSADEIDEVLSYADKIIFNSISQLNAFKGQAAAKNIPVGLRLNQRPVIHRLSSLILRVLLAVWVNMIKNNCSGT